MQLNDSPFTPEIKVQLNGKEFTLSFPIPAIWAAEDATGIGIMNGEIFLKLPKMNARERSEMIVKIGWAGLITNHPELTLEQLGKMLYPATIIGFEAKMAEALSASMPKPEQKDEGDAKSPLATENVGSSAA